VSGDKSGVIGIWDLGQGELVRALKTHKGNVSKIAIDGKLGLIHSIGLNDGTLATLDMRTNQGVYRQMLHKGATNDIKIVENKVVTCSADHTINVLEIPSFKTSVNIDIKDMAFVLEYAPGVIIAGTSGGNIVASDINKGDILYGYGVMKKGECRLLGFSPDKKRLVCAGED
jgi:WD40 repeat protein